MNLEDTKSKFFMYKTQFSRLDTSKANHQMLKTNTKVLKEASDSVVEKLYRLK